MDKTEIELDKTAIERGNTTVREDITEIESSSVNNTKQDIQFQDYRTIKQFPTSGAEADIYLLEKKNIQFVLKLYRFNIKPSREMIDKLKELGQKYPEDIIEIYDIGFDENSGRWYELQEYAKFGSLKDLMQNDQMFLRENIEDVIREMALVLKTLHSENIIHRDIKPDNLLVRSIEPLDLVITDFGISSVIDEEFSKKMTTKSGTRIYFSPESFSGVIGKEVDYWAMGMILLEILIGDNIFRGINEGMIAYEIFTKGVEVPEDMDPDIRLLLKGLLTREPKKRWGSGQIFKWLAGERDISVHYSYVDSQGEETIPYTFKSKKYYNIKELLAVMYEEENYEDGKTHIMRGYITKWLENNKQLDTVVIMERFFSQKNPDFAFFQAFNYFVQPEKLLFLGKVITIDNVTRFVGLCLNKQASKNEKKICEMIKDGDLYKVANDFFHKKEPDKELLNILSKILEIEELQNIYFLLKLYKILEENISLSGYYEFIQKNYHYPHKFIMDVVMDNILVNNEKDKVYIYNGENIYYITYNKTKQEFDTVFIMKNEEDFLLEYADLFFKKIIKRSDLTEDMHLYLEASRIAKSITKDNVNLYGNIYMRYNIYEEKDKIIRFMENYPNPLIEFFLTNYKCFTLDELKKIEKKLEDYNFIISSGANIVSMIVLLFFYTIIKNKDFHFFLFMFFWFIFIVLFMVYRAKHSFVKV